MHLSDIQALRTGNSSELALERLRNKGSHLVSWFGLYLVYKQASVAQPSIGDVQEASTLLYSFFGNIST